MKKLEQYEVDFIAETYIDPEWNPISIAQKLEICEQTVRYYARNMGLKRPNGGFTKRECTAQHDWETLYYARMARYPYERAIELAGMKMAAARNAMRSMLNMTEAERIMRWNRYRAKHGMPLFTKC